MIPIYRPITAGYEFLPKDVRIGNDGTVWDCSNGLPGEQLAPKFNENGKPLLEFLMPGGKRFLYWLQIEVYKLFVGVIPKGSEVYAIDNNKANLAVSNLALRANEPQVGYRITNLPMHPGATPTRPPHPRTP